MQYTEYIKQQLKNILSIPSPSGFTKKAAEYMMQELGSMGYKPYMTNKGCVCVDLGGEGHPVLLGAHIDTLGGMVAEIKPSGALRITRIGGLNANNVEGENCTIFTRDSRSYTGVCQLENASIHVNASYDDTKRTFDTVEVLIDEVVESKADVKALGISVGDYVCSEPRTVITDSGYIKSRFLDDKLSAAILLAYAKRLSDEHIVPSRKVYLYFTVYEEVGHGGASGMPSGIEELIAVDMGCVGKGLECKETQLSICAKDSAGPSDYELTTRLINTAKANNIDYAVDVYPSYSSDMDVALKAGQDAAHCVIGSGVYASHGYERTHMKGVEGTLKLIEAYIG